MASLDKCLSAVVSTLGGEKREGQIQMMHAVDDALRNNKHLLVQAGTGTGKSVAYLLPAITFAMERKTCVVISTATLALQAQLVNRDLPRIAKALEPVLGRAPRFAVAKGRHHYICKARLNTSVTEPDDDEDESAALFAKPTSRLGKEVKRVRTWAYQTSTGDREELEPSPDPRVWRALSVAGNECVGADRCRWGSECFTEKVRNDAESADVVITNHAMLAIHKIDGHRLLPDHSAVIIDEGHELADRATGQASEEITAGIVEKAAIRCRRLIDPTLVMELEEAADDLRLTLDDVAQLQPKRIVMDVAEYGENAAQFFVSQRVLVPALARIRDVCAEIGKEFSNLQRKDPDPELEELAARTLAKASVSEIHTVVTRLLKLRDHDVAWLERGEHRAPVIRVAPLTVSQLLSESLFGDIPVIVTSATLTLGGSFDPIAKSLGLVAQDKGLEDEADPDDFVDMDYDEDGNPIPPKPAVAAVLHQWDSLDVGTPFDAQAQGVLYIASHLPPPGRDGLSEEQAQELCELVLAAGGRTLALFSSWRGVDKAQEALSAAVSKAHLDINILVQRRGDVVADLVKQFARDTTSVLLGTVSLWQGVDVPGESCSLVVIDRIPFPRPDDPLHAARSARIDRAGGSGFRSVAVPRAALLLAQGAGRLLRSQNDRGMVAVLDSRLASAGYAQFLIQSMPDLWRTTDPQVARAALSRLGARLSQ